MNKYGLNKEEAKEEIKWAMDKINYYTNKIYDRKLKLEIKRQELLKSLDNSEATEEEIIDLISYITRLTLKIEELKKDIKRYYDYMKELEEDI